MTKIAEQSDMPLDLIAGDMTCDLINQLNNSQISPFINSVCVLKAFSRTLMSYEVVKL